MMLSAAELSAIRLEAENVLPSTSSIERATLSADGYGGSGESWAEVGTPDCRVDPLGSENAQNLAAEFGERLQGRRTAALFFAYGEDVQKGDRVTVDSVVWEVLKMDEGRSWEILVRGIGVEVE